MPVLRIVLIPSPKEDNPVAKGARSTRNPGAGEENRPPTKVSALHEPDHAGGNVRGNTALDHLAVTSNFQGLSRIPSTLGADQLPGRECQLKSLFRTVKSRTAQNK